MHVGDMSQDFLHHAQVAGTGWHCLECSGTLPLPPAPTDQRLFSLIILNAVETQIERLMSVLDTESVAELGPNC